VRVWLIRLLTFSGDSNVSQWEWAKLWAVIDQTAPADKRVAIAAIKAEHEEASSLAVFPIRQIVGNTVTLVLGFLVHAFA
jgi:hypothetical protein